jgi:hypothetical protein
VFSDIREVFFIIQFNTVGLGIIYVGLPKHIGG